MGVAGWLEKETECESDSARAAAGGGGGGDTCCVQVTQREPPSGELRLLSESMAGPGACRRTKKPIFTDSRFCLQPSHLVLRRLDKERRSR